MAKPSGLGKGIVSIFQDNANEDKNSIVMLKISEIEPNIGQPRQEFDEKALSDLAESIAIHGLLQPILVRPLINGGYEIVAGERRYRASRMAGLYEIPVIVRDLSDSQTMELALIENLQRENLNPLEEADGFKTLMEEYGFSQDDVARSVGKSRPAVANAMRLLNLPFDIKLLVSKGDLSAGHARALLSLENEQDMLEVTKIIIEKALSVRQTEKFVKEYSSIDTEEEKVVKVKKTEKIVKAFMETELALSEHLGKKVKVIPSKNKEGGILQIEFYSEDELFELAKLLDSRS